MKVELSKLSSFFSLVSVSSFFIFPSFLASQTSGSEGIENIKEDDTIAGSEGVYGLSLEVVVHFEHTTLPSDNESPTPIGVNYCGAERSLVIRLVGDRTAENRSRESHFFIISFHCKIGFQRKAIATMVYF